MKRLHFISPNRFLFIYRFTSKMWTQNFQREGRWVSIWRASRSTTPSTSEDRVVCSFTKAEVSARTGSPQKSSPWWYKVCFSCLMWCCDSPCTGVFAIQPEKKSPAVTKNAKHLGMIAGGTGKETVFNQEVDTSRLMISLRLNKCYTLKIFFHHCSCSLKVNVLLI